MNQRREDNHRRQCPWELSVLSDLAGAVTVPCQGGQGESCVVDVVSPKPSGILSRLQRHSKSAIVSIQGDCLMVLRGDEGSETAIGCSTGSGPIPFASIEASQLRQRSHTEIWGRGRRVRQYSAWRTAEQAAIHRVQDRDAVKRGGSGPKETRKERWRRRGGSAAAVVPLGGGERQKQGRVGMVQDQGRTGEEFLAMATGEEQSSAEQDFSG